MGGRNYVNIQIETPLSSRKFYYLNFGNGLKYYYLLSASSNEHPDEDYRLSLPYNITSICTPIDSDGDTIPDSTDNCPSTPNTNQLDTDNDGIGNVCDNNPTQPQTYKSHVFYSSIDNIGTITEQVALENCGEIYNFQQLGGRNYVNIQTETPLKPKKFYYLNFGRGLNYYYLLNSSTNEHNDEDYRINAHREITKVCLEPDLKAEEVSVSSSTIDHGETKTVSYEVKNIGESHANSSRCKFYLSKDGRLVDLLDNISIGSVSVNQTKTGSVTLTIPLGTATDTYNIVMEVSTSGESNTGNNKATSSSSFRVNGIQALPNLTLESLKINVTNQGSFNVFPGENTPTFRYNSSTNFEVKIKNNDDGDSGNFSCLLLVSGSNDAYPQPNGFPVYNFRTLNFSGINANSSSMLDITETIYDYIGGLDLLEGQTYFMYLHIDYDEDVTESNENDSDNISHFAFRYNNPTNKMSNPQKNNQQQFLIDTYNSTILKENYKVDIFDLTGRLVKSIKSNSIEQENKIINTLPSGLYIIKTPSGFRKIAK